MTEGAAKTGLEGVRVVELATVVAGPGALCSLLGKNLGKKFKSIALCKV